MLNKNLIILYGPTAVGKTKLAINLAKYFQSEIFSCDSRQFYKELNIAVAKPEPNELLEVKHHFIDNISIFEHYSISKFEIEANKALEEYFKYNNIAIMCGGSGLYIDALCNGIDEMPDYDPQIRKEVNDFYKKNGIEALRFELQKIDPEYYNIVDLKNYQRIIRAIEYYKQCSEKFSNVRKNNPVLRNYNIYKIGLNIDRNILYEKINNRVDKMISMGLVEECKTLYEYRNLVALKTIGYREIFDYLDNKITLSQAIENIKTNTRRYAKRQLTWFNRYNNGIYYSPNDEKKIIEHIKLLTNKNN